ncbi:hypothetical protein Tco_1327223 [Tanacetum coccineum]
MKSFMSCDHLRDLEAIPVRSIDDFFMIVDLYVKLEENWEVLGKTRQIKDAKGKMEWLSFYFCRNIFPKEKKTTEISQSSGPTEPIADEATNEENRVLDLENTKIAQAQEILSLKLRFKRLEKKGWSRTHKLKRLFKVGRYAQVVSSKDEGLGDQEDASKRGGSLLSFIGEEVFTGQDVVEKEVSTVDPNTTAGEVVTTASVEVSVATTTTTIAITEVDLTLAQALAELRSAKPKVVVQEPVQEKSIVRQVICRIQKLFNKAMTRVNMFVDMDTELVKESSKKAEAEMARESSSKRTGEELEQEVSRFIENEGNGYYEIMGANEVPRHAYCLVNCSKSLTEKTWKIYRSWLKLSMGIQGQKKSIPYYLWVEKMYPLTKHTLHQMFNDVKLQVDYECEMAFELLRLVKKQLKEGYVPQ